jgi:hypothetical protein
MLPDKVTALVYVNGVSDDFEGQVTLRGGHVIYSQFEMPDAHSSDQLAQENCRCSR